MHSVRENLYPLHRIYAAATSHLYVTAYKHADISRLAASVTANGPFVYS